MKKFLSEYPKLIKEWHPTKNGDSRPEEFPHGSGEKVWWLCPNGHSYDSIIKNRTIQKTGCQKCKKLDFLFPEISKEWHPTKNGDSKPEEFTGRNGKKVWWLCPKGHDYDSVIGSRTSLKTGCPYCSGRRVGEDNNLKLLFPKISYEWNPTKNGSLKPEDFTGSSHEKVWWLCPKGHSYYSRIYDRTGINKTGCPYCSGRRVGEDNNLLYLFPKIAKEWHPTKNGDSKPEEFTGRNGKKVWWLCPKGHSYDSIIYSRTSINKTGCPYCSNQTSSPELRILAEFRFIFDDVKNRHKIEGVEMDVSVPKFNLAIEYDGYHFHQGKEKKDLEKNEFLQKRNIEIFRVRCSPLTKITENDLIVENDDLSKSDLNEVFKKIYSFVDTGIKEKINEYLDSDHFFNENLFKKYLSYLPSPLPENSLTIKFPDLVNEWDYGKNHPLIPDQFSVGSNNKVWWLCPKGHSYDSRIRDRTGKIPTGCPECSGKKVGKDNNLKIMFPKIAKEWHPTENGDLKPYQVTHGSEKRVWWLCPKGHSYDSIICSRTKKKPTGCPYCSGQKVGEDNNLLFLFPKIAKEWHPTKNGDSKPEEFTGRNGKKVWWLCPKGHSYDSIISNRTSKIPTGCPHCYRNSS
jgi:hypothetical protein